MAPTFEVLRPGLAAEVRGVDLGDALDPGMLEWIIAVWRGHPVLVFREQPLTPDAQLAFSRQLGALDRAPSVAARRTDLPGYPEIAVLSNIVVDGTPIGGLDDGDPAWHSDRTDAPSPPVACLLHAREVPPHGRIAADGGGAAGALLETLWRHVDQAAAEHVYRHAWRRGDAVLWNNLAVMYRREASDAAARRLLHRTQIRRLHPRWEGAAREPVLSV